MNAPTSNMGQTNGSMMERNVGSMPDEQTMGSETMETMRSMNGGQSGGARRRRKSAGIPGVRNVLRVTGSTVGKIRNVGVYGIKKVGNGVHVITGLVDSSVNAVTRAISPSARKSRRTKKSKRKTAKRRD